MTHEELPLRWKKGYRCCGYWLGDERIGLVSIGPKGHWKREDGYNWSIGETAESGNCEILAKARRLDREYL